MAQSITDHFFACKILFTLSSQLCHFNWKKKVPHYKATSQRHSGFCCGVRLSQTPLELAAAPRLTVHEFSRQLVAYSYHFSRIFYNPGDRTPSPSPLAGTFCFTTNPVREQEDQVKLGLSAPPPAADPHLHLHSITDSGAQCDSLKAPGLQVTKKKAEIKRGLPWLRR